MANKDGTKSGGRKKGRINKVTAGQSIEAIASGLSPMGFLLSVMRDESEDKRERIDAAKAVAPYIHPRLSNVDMKTTIQEVTDPKELTSEELHREVKRALSGV